jgi:hypothetical protein
MQATHRQTPTSFARICRLALPLAAAGLLAAVVLAPARADEADTVSRPAAARDAARRDADRKAPDVKPKDEEFVCFRRGFEGEPIRDLLDKYGPSAVEWSLLLKVAQSSQRRAVSGP